MELFAESYEAQALRDENQWLLQCLHASEQNCKQLQSVTKQQQRRVKKLERAASANQSAAEEIERQWRSRLQQKEKEWMQEYDSQMQALLRIIHHHEIVHAQLEKELRNAVVDSISNATQTDSLSYGDGDDDMEASSVQSTHHQQVAPQSHEGCSSCSRASPAQSMEDESPPHPFAIQQLFERLETAAARTNHTSSSSEMRSRRYQQSSPNRELNFRASILQRLRRPSRCSYSQSKARSLPPTIPEEDESEDKSGAHEEGNPNPSHSRCEVAESVSTTTDLAVSSVFRNLEEQNRLLQERLTSQQTVLDQLLSSKLHDATDNPTTAAATSKEISAGEDQMIKLGDHFKASDRQVRIGQFDDLNRVEKAVEQRHPLSPSAA